MGSLRGAGAKKLEGRQCDATLERMLVLISLFIYGMQTANQWTILLEEEFDKVNVDEKYLRLI